MSPRRNRALLVGVSTYEDKKPPGGVPGDLPAVEHNLTMLRRALLKGGVFDADSIRVCRSPSQAGFSEAVRSAAEEADGLLLLYFAGHGVTPSSGDPLFLQMRDARVIAGRHPVFHGAAKYDDVQAELLTSKAERIVVVLDCCYAGNAGLAWERVQDYQRKRRVLLLMSVQANHRIDAGDARTPTPFTARLVQLLEKPAALWFSSLSDQLRQDMAEQKTMRGDSWMPQSRAEHKEDVLLSERPATGAVKPPQLGSDDGPPGRPPFLERLRRRAAVLAALGTVVLTIAVFALGSYLYALVGDSPTCAPPLELRVLTDPDLESTVTAAANTYVTSQENTDGEGCRVSGITVYSAGAADVVTALREDSGAWEEPGGELNPQRDIGPQPDIWIPGSPADVERVTDGQDSNAVAKLKPQQQPFAYSPIVLAVPEDMSVSSPDVRTGHSLTQLIDALGKRHPDAEVRRPDPEFADAALLATKGLYGSGDARAAEQELDGPALPDLTGAGLLCTLPETPEVDRRTAALVPEFLLNRKPGVGCHSATRHPRVAEYPSDVPGLEPTFVRVTWRDGFRDRAARDEAAGNFRTWLTGEQGREVLARAGFREPTSPRALMDASWAKSNGVMEAPGPLVEPAGRMETETALEQYRAAHGPGRVLFLLDSSGSMGTVWQGPSGGPGLLKQSLDGLGGQDEYGVWAVADAFGGDPYETLLGMGTHDRKAAARTIDGAAEVRDAEAEPYDALLAALDTMEELGADGRPQLIVYVTDGEDHDNLTGKLADLVSQVDAANVPVAMVSLKDGACAKGKPDARISAAGGGRCLDAADDLGAALAREVARTGLGDE